MTQKVSIFIEEYMEIFINVYVKNNISGNHIFLYLKRVLKLLFVQPLFNLNLLIYFKFNDLGSFESKGCFKFRII